MPNSECLVLPHVLAEALVAPQHGPGHQGEVFQLHHLLTHGKNNPHTKFQAQMTSKLPKRGTCSSRTWPSLTDPGLITEVNLFQVNYTFIHRFNPELVTIDLELMFL